MYCSTLQSFRGAPREAVVRQGAHGADVSCDVLAGTRNVEIEIEIVPDGATVPGTTPSGCRAYGACSKCCVRRFSPRTTSSSSRDRRADAATSSTTCSLTAHPRLGCRPRRPRPRAPAPQRAVAPARRPPRLRGRCHARRLGRPAGPDRGASRRLPGGAGSSPCRPTPRKPSRLSPRRPARFEMRYVRSWDGPLSDALRGGTARRPAPGDDDRRPATRRARALRRWPRRPHAAFPGPPAMRGPLAAARESPPHDHRSPGAAPGAAPRRRLLRARRRTRPGRSSESCLPARRS